MAAIAGGLDDLAAVGLDRLAQHRVMVRERAGCIAGVLRSHSRVLPSMSVNRKVTVPVGSEP